MSTQNARSGMPRRVVVIGAGGAGSAAAQVLSQAAQDLHVVVVGQEDRPPYNRTTVNKGLLSGAADDHAVALPGMDLPAVTWRVGERVVSLDPPARAVLVEGGELLTADAVVLATGARPRPLQLPVTAAAADRVVTLRSAADTERLLGLLTPGARVLILGAGLIGAETAGVLVEAGHPVQLVDAAPLPMAGLVGSTVADWIVRAHRDAGVDVRLGTTLRDISSQVGGVLAVTLSDGTFAAPEAVLSALGVTPDTEWLAGSGVLDDDCAGAAIVDAHQRVVGWPGIYAAGDMAAAPGPDGHPVRVEHWGAALAQGRTAARTVLVDLGLRKPEGAAPVELPSYSTYVHGTKLTVLGWPAAAAGEIPLLGAAGDDRFAVALHDEQGRLVAAVGVGGAKAVNRIRPLIERRAPATDLEQAA
jgi:NADPH-dependent 2,4-dienoyl-CoA reductase/sulfur reductase-like enzyme